MARWSSRANCQSTNNGHLLLTLGYTGWASGQLEHELSVGYWLPTAATIDYLFEYPRLKLYDQLCAQIGIKASCFSTQTGMA